MARVEYEKLASEIVDSCFQVHTALGPGLLESAYQACLAHELRERGLEVDQEVPMPLAYKGLNLDVGYRIDLLVDRKIIVELKAVDEVHPIHTAQLITYLKLAKLPLGFLVNFKVQRIKSGIKRIANNY